MYYWAFLCAFNNLLLRSVNRIVCAGLWMLIGFCGIFEANMLIYTVWNNFAFYVSVTLWFFSQLILNQHNWTPFKYEIYVIQHTKHNDISAHLRTVYKNSYTDSNCGKTEMPQNMWPHRLVGFFGYFHPITETRVIASVFSDERVCTAGSRKLGLETPFQLDFHMFRREFT